MATPTQVVDSIKQITQKSQALQEPAQTISIVNGPLLMVGQGPYPPIIHGLSDIVNTTQTSFPQMIGMKQVAAGKDADAIHDAFREFAQVNKTLFDGLGKKAELFNSMPVITQPMAASIRSIEGVYDALAFTLMDKVPDRKSDLQSEYEALSKTVQQAVKAHEG